MAHTPLAVMFTCLGPASLSHAPCAVVPSRFAVHTAELPELMLSSTHRAGKGALAIAHNPDAAVAQVCHMHDAALAGGRQDDRGAACGLVRVTILMLPRYNAVTTGMSFSVSESQSLIGSRFMSWQAAARSLCS